MHNVMLLIETLADAEALHSQVDLGGLRASAKSMAGPWEGIAFATSSEPRSLTTTRSDGCPEGVPCDAVPMLPLGRVVTSKIKPADYIVFALLTALPGAVRKAADHITASEPPAGVEEASCYVFGREDVQIVLEVAGNDQDAVLSRVLELTDIEHVARVRTIHTTRTMTNGFGGELRAAMAGAVQT